MEMCRDNNSEKRKRKPVAKSPVLVRSVKPGQAQVASYERGGGGSNAPAQGFWRR